jgi:hypothetical protein
MSNQSKLTTYPILHSKIKSKKLNLKIKEKIKNKRFFFKKTTIIIIIIIKKNSKGATPRADLGVAETTPKDLVPPPRPIRVV